MIRRLDHVAVLVKDTDSALAFFRDGLGLRVASQERISHPPARLTYLELGNAYLQLVEPLDDSSPIAEDLRRTGEGIHHVCFGADDVAEGLATLGGEPERLGSGRGRVSGFLQGPAPHGVRVELTEFDRDADVDESDGWLPR